MHRARLSFQSTAVVALALLASAITLTGCGESDPGTVSTSSGDGGPRRTTSTDGGVHRPAPSIITTAPDSRAGSGGAGGDQPAHGDAELLGEVPASLAKGVFDPDQVYAGFYLKDDLLRMFIAPALDMRVGVGVGRDQSHPVIHPRSGRLLYLDSGQIGTFTPYRALVGDETAEIHDVFESVAHDLWTPIDERVDDCESEADAFFVNPGDGEIVYRCREDADGVYRTDRGRQIEVEGKILHIGYDDHMLVERSIGEGLGVYTVFAVVGAQGNATEVEARVHAGHAIRAGRAGFMVINNDGDPYDDVNSYLRWHIGYDGSVGLDGVYTFPPGLEPRGDDDSIECNAIYPNGDAACQARRDEKPVILRLRLGQAEPVAEVPEYERAAAYASSELITGP